MKDGRLYELVGCKGVVSDGNFSVPVTFDIGFSSNSRIDISLPGIPFCDDSLPLYHFAHEAGRLASTLAVSGRGPGMESVVAAAVVSRCGTNSTPAGTMLTLEVSAQSAEVNIDSAAERGDVIVDYFVQGLRGFGVAAVDTSWGRLTAGASHSVDDYTEVTGQLRLEVAAPEDLAAGLDDADGHVRRVLELLSFAQGLRLEWGARQVYVNGRLRSLKLYSMSQPDRPKFEVFSHLDLEPALRLAVDRYTPELIERTGLDVALYWYLSQSRYLDEEIVAGMIAFESLLRSLESKAPCLVLSKEAFNDVVRPFLFQAASDALANVPDLLNKTEVLGVLQAQIAGINRPTFRESLVNLFATYQVPITDLEADLPALIKIRNHIVHRGSHSHRNPAAKDVGLYAAKLRELFVRTVLTLLGYSGEYYSFLNGPERKTFAPG